MAAAGDSNRTRLGLFVDAPYRRDAAGGKLWSGSEALGFTRFATAVGAHFADFTLVARETVEQELTPYEVPGRANLASLPHYPSLRAMGEVLVTVPRTVRAMWRALEDLDLVWISAGHPLGLVLLALCRIRGRRAAILVRQDSMAYFRARLPSRAWRAGLLPLWLVDRAFRFAGRRLPVTAVGPQLAEQFGAPRANVTSFTVNLMATEATVPGETAETSQAPAPGQVVQLGDPIEVLTVGRMEPEKDPETLLGALELLERRQPGRYRLTWVGAGRLREQIVASAARRGLSERLELPGFVAMGEGLEEFYARAHLFVHVALTEGVPQVLGEAMAHGLPIVATDVGGVAGELGGGEAGLLVPPARPEQLADKIVGLADDSSLRCRLAQAGLRRAAETAIGPESERVAHFLAGTRSTA